MEGENIECLHPVQAVLDALCGENKATYAKQLETWFEEYTKLRGIQGKAFKPLTACAAWLQMFSYLLVPPVTQPTTYF